MGQTILAPLRKVEEVRDMAEGKTLDALMRASHCGAPNRRVEYAMELSKVN